MVDEVTHIGLMDEAEIQLDRAALQIAALDHAGVDIAPYLELIDLAEARLRSRSSSASAPSSSGSPRRRLLLRNTPATLSKPAKSS